MTQSVGQHVCERVCVCVRACVCLYVWCSLPIRERKLHDPLETLCGAQHGLGQLCLHEFPNNKVQYAVGATI